MIQVRLHRLLPSRLRNLGPELAKFGTIGLINTVLNFLVFNILLLTIFADGELKAKAVAALVATTASYFMNRHWTYRDLPRAAVRREYSLFFIFNLAGLAIEVAALGIAKYGLGTRHWFWLNVFTGIGIVIGTLFRFWAYRTHVFKKTSHVVEDAPLTLTELVAHELEEHHLHGEQANGAAKAESGPLPPAQSRTGATGDDFDGELDDLVARSDRPLRST